MLVTGPRGIFCIPSLRHDRVIAWPGTIHHSNVSLGGDVRGDRVLGASAQWIFVRNLGHYHKMYSSIACCYWPIKNEIALSHKQPVTKWAKTNFPWWSPDLSRIVKNLKSQNNIWWSRDETDPSQAAVPNPEITRLLGICEAPDEDCRVGSILYLFNGIVLRWDKWQGHLWNTREDTCWDCWVSLHHLSSLGSPHYSEMSDARQGAPG